MQSDLGKLGKLTGAIQNSFFGRFILPFATAPTNSMLRTAENTPLGFYNVAAGKTPRERQLAFGKATMGSGAMLLFAHHAAEGRITGSRPRGKAAQEALPPKWQPYSFVIRDEGFPEGMPLYDEYGRPNGPLRYISYAGFEPVGAIIGISADYAQRASELPPGEGAQQYLMDRAALATSAITGYMSELPMLQGIGDIADALNGEGLENILRSYPQSAAYPGIVPNPLSGLQRGLYDLGLFGGDPRVVRPRQDLEYYTLDEVMAVDEDGNYVFGTTPGGEPKGLAKLGQVKNSTLDKLLDAIDSYQDMDSYFTDQYDTNAVEYDTFGEEKTSTSLSIANAPLAAFRNRILGIRIEPGEELTPTKAELMRLYGETGKWPLSNKESLRGIQLSFGAQSDWTRIAKREAEVPVPMLGNLTLKFSEALELLTTGQIEFENGDVLTNVFNSYSSDSSEERLRKIGNLEDTFYNATIANLFEEKDSSGNFRYTNLSRVYNDLEMQGQLEEMTSR
jgi:hypothetical protein